MSKVEKRKKKVWKYHPLTIENNNATSHDKNDSKTTHFRDPFFGPFLTIFLQKGKSYEKKGMKMTPPHKNVISDQNLYIFTNNQK